MGVSPCPQGRACETDTDLRDTEQVPLLEEGGIEAFIRREVLAYTPDAWMDESATKIGYEVSLTRHFYKPKPLRTLDTTRLAVIKGGEWSNQANAAAIFVKGAVTGAAGNDW